MLKTASIQSNERQLYILEAFFEEIRRNVSLNFKIFPKLIKLQLLKLIKIYKAYKEYITAKFSTIREIAYADNRDEMLMV